MTIAIPRGVLLALFGIAFAWHAAQSYPPGTLRHMGPGMFPAALGVVLAGFGGILVLSGLTSGSGGRIHLRLWSPCFVLGGVAAFALTINAFGLIPAILAVTVISSFAELKVRPVSLLLCATLCLIAWRTFKVGLGLAWPFQDRHRMDFFSNLAIGLETALSLTNLFYCFLGVLPGMITGVIPGIGVLSAISLLVPITFYLHPATALIMLAGIWYGTGCGGRSASILLNIPGTPANAVTCLDGYPMARQGGGGVALFMTTVASFVGGSVGILLLR